MRPKSVIFITCITYFVGISVAAKIGSLPSEGLPFTLLTFLSAIAVVMMFVLMIVMMIHMFRSDLPRDSKIAWTVFFVIGTILASTVYYVRRYNDEVSA